HWVHAEHLLFEGRKMSKSAQNVVLVEDLIDKGIHPLGLRLVFLEHRYRQQMDLTWNSLKAADKTLKRWYRLISEWQKSSTTPINNEHPNRIQSYMEDDLDTVNVILLLREVEKSNKLSDFEKLNIFKDADKWLGLNFSKKNELDEDFSPEVLRLAELRKEARTQKDFKRSDDLRDQLAILGILAIDTADGQRLIQAD
ncbi:MAG: class I tRNA ligase family protein, partial [Candidatus Nanopelagicales bacterium]